MQKLNKFSSNHPLLFSLLIFPTIPYVIMGIFITVGDLVGYGNKGVSFYQLPVNIGSTVVYLLILWRFGWLRRIGYLSIGKLSIWSLMFFIAIVESSLIIYSLNGEFKLSNLFNFSEPMNKFIISIFEETAFRGLILFIFLNAWSRSKFGVYKSVVISSFLFGIGHIATIFSGNTVSGAIFQSLSSFSSGILYSGVLLYGGSIWIPIFDHALSNALGHGNTPVTVDYSMVNFLIFLIDLPLAFIGILFIQKYIKRNSQMRENGNDVVYKKTVYVTTELTD